MLTQDRLKEVLNYNKDTGELRWKQKIGSKSAGSIANAKDSNGYIRLKIDGKKYLGHRLAWLYVYGVMPSGHIDHINRVVNDNKINNLRDVNRGKNMRNCKRRDDNTSGVTGVSWNKRVSLWQSYISFECKLIHLGCFYEFHEAVNARMNAEALYDNDNNKEFKNV